MSSISSGVDLTVKYQRLAVEYVKVRNQVSVLKSALLEEQSKRADLGREVAQGETRLFKLEAERDSLLFRNEQLLKRVEGLQESMDAQQATFGMAKGKKKHKEANLRLVAESSRMHRQALSGPSSSDPLSVLEGELERKINENSQLHSKLFDVERRFDETVAAFTRRIDDLETENEALKNANSLQCDAKRQTDFGICESESGATGQTLPTEANARGESAPAAFGPLTDSTDGVLCSSTDESASFQSPPDQQTIDTGKPSDFVATPSSDFETQQSDGGAAAALLEKYSVDRISTLSKSLQHATGRATYYKQECEELLRKAICDQQCIETLKRSLCELTSKCHSLNDALETTQFNYEAQLRELHEHLATNEEKRRTNDQTTGGGSPNSGDTGQQNGGRNGTNEKVRRSHWFSSASSSSSKG